MDDGHRIADEGNCLSLVATAGEDGTEPCRIRKLSTKRGPKRRRPAEGRYDAPEPPAPQGGGIDSRKSRERGTLPPTEPTPPADTTTITTRSSYYYTNRHALIGTPVRRASWHRCMCPSR